MKIEIENDHDFVTRAIQNALLDDAVACEIEASLIDEGTIDSVTVRIREDADGETELSISYPRALAEGAGLSAACLLSPSKRKFNSTAPRMAHPTGERHEKRTDH